MRHAKRTDGNHAAIRDGLREWLGGKDKVIDTSRIGNGIPDLIVVTPGGRAFWMELKIPGETLTEDEEKFFRLFPQISRMACSLDEAKAVVQDFDMEVFE